MLHLTIVLLHPCCYFDPLVAATAPAAAADDDGGCYFDPVVAATAPAAAAATDDDDDDYDDDGGGGGAAADYRRMFEARQNPSTAPFVIWLTGGPGCSSMLAMLSENGPCTVNADLSTTLNPYSWTESVNMLWIDQPTGVGFSYGASQDYLHDEAGVGENMYQFLQAFFQAHPEYAANDFYVTGESYGKLRSAYACTMLFLGGTNCSYTRLYLLVIALLCAFTAGRLSRRPLCPLDLAPNLAR